MFLFMLERKNNIGIYSGYIVIVYGVDIINNMKLIILLSFDIQRETTSTFLNSLFYLLASAFALILITFDIYLFLPIHRELFFLLSLHLV